MARPFRKRDNLKWTNQISYLIILTTSSGWVLYLSIAKGTREMIEETGRGRAKRSRGVGEEVGAYIIKQARSD